MAKNPKATDVYVGARIRSRRMQIGISQETLGQRLGLTFQQVQKYEKGMNRVGASRLQEISNILAVPISYFFEGAPDAGTLAAHTPSDSVTRFLVNPNGLVIANAFTRINQKTQRKIAALCVAIADDDRDEYFADRFMQAEDLHTREDPKPC